jgi:hypothetical protein
MTFVYDMVGFLPGDEMAHLDGAIRRYLRL